MRFRDWEAVRKELKSVGTYLKNHPRAIAIGGTALVYYGLKRSTRDIDLAFPTQGECFWFAEALRESGYELRKGEAVWRFIDFERDLYVDISYGKIGDVSPSQAMFSRLKEERIDEMSVWIPALEDLFIMKACHSIDTYETDAIGDAKRIYEKIDMKIVHNELRNQNERVNEKVKRWLSEFVERK